MKCLDLSGLVQCPSKLEGLAFLCLGAGGSSLASGFRAPFSFKCLNHFSCVQSNGAQSSENPTARSRANLYLSSRTFGSQALAIPPDIDSVELSDSTSESSRRS